MAACFLSVYIHTADLVHRPKVQQQMTGGVCTGTAGQYGFIQPKGSAVMQPFVRLHLAVHT